MSAAGGEAAGVFVDLGARVAETLARLREARGVTVGGSPRRAVWRHGKTTLYRYLPLEPARGGAGAEPSAAAAATDAGGSTHARSAARPLLICFALVNRPYILDLEPEFSLIRRLLEAGLTVYLIDWGDADDGDRLRDLNDYIDGELGGCVRYILGAHGIDALDLMGVCQGGVFALCYTALHPQQVANLVTLTAPVDFHTPEDLLSKWLRGIDTALLARAGNVPGEVLNAIFLSLMPFRLMQQKYVRLLAGRPERRALETFVRMERWIFDSPPQAAVALTEFIRWLYQDNRLVRGTLSLGGRSVDLGRIRQPILNLYAAGDHIVPPAASAAMGRYVGSSDYTACAIETGHIGMYVSRKGRAEIPGRIVAWLRERQGR